MFPERQSAPYPLLPPKAASICSLFVFCDFGDIRRCRSIASKSVCRQPAPFHDAASRSDAPNPTSAQAPPLPPGARICLRGFKDNCHAASRTHPRQPGHQLSLAPRRSLRHRPADARGLAHREHRSATRPWHLRCASPGHRRRGRTRASSRRAWDAGRPCA